METIGLTTAAAALDAALKAAEVQCVGVEKVIGVDKVISVTVSIVGEVAAVKSAVEAGVMAASAVGKVVSSHVIPRPHSDVDKLIDMFRKDKAQPAETQEVENQQAEVPDGEPAGAENTPDESVQEPRARRA